MRNFVMAALLVLFSNNGVASAAEDDTFEIEAEGSYRMEAGSSIDLAKKMALYTAKRKAVDLAGRYLLRQSLPAAARNEMANHDDLSGPFGKKIPELGQHLYGQSHNSLYFA